MTALLVAAAVAGWVLALVLLLLLPWQTQRRAVASALRLRSSVEPYLRRCAAALAGGTPPPTAPTMPPEEIVAAVCALADRLTEHERQHVELGDTLNIASSDTMPVDVAK